MKKRSLESFNSKTLAEFIRANIFLYDLDWQRKLEQIEARQEWDALQAENDKLLAEAVAMQGRGNPRRHREIHNRVDRNWARQNKLMPNMFPSLDPATLTYFPEREKSEAS